MGFYLGVTRVLVLQVILSRPHQHADRRRGLVVSGRVLVKCVCVVDPQQRRDSGGPDVEDSRVRNFTVDLHHHLKVFVSYDAVCNHRKAEAR